MSLLQRIRAFFARRRPVPLHERWFVTFDDRMIHLRFEPPGGEKWSEDLPWDSITRICFHAADFTRSDGIYLFTSRRPESYAIPTEGCGGNELWSEILRRKLFDHELAIEAMRSAEGVFCWPRDEPAAE